MHFSFLADAAPGYHALSEEESTHLVRVLRMKSGTDLRITDGKGKLYHAVLIDAHPKKAMLEVGELLEVKTVQPAYIHLAIAPTKNMDRLEWFIEKVVELGVHEISLFSSFHSERRNLRMDRLEKVALSALKQSKNTFLPIINPLLSFNEFITREFAGQRFIAYIDEKPGPTLSNVLQTASDVVVLIGPEGDFSKEEVSLALENGFQSVSLGDSRLRTETAGVFACSVVHIVNQLNNK